MSDELNIHWFPGHMAKAKRNIEDSLKLIDAVIEIRDARCPLASANEDLAALYENKPRLVVLNRIDLADGKVTQDWCRYFERFGFSVLCVDSKSGAGISAFKSKASEVLKDKIARQKEKGIKPVLRFMVVGIPNVGKSSFINRIAGKRAANTADKPGVTRGKQWINCGGGIELLDTPGILPPKIDNPASGEILAVTGAVRDEVVDTVALASRFLSRIRAQYEDKIRAQYKLRPDDTLDPVEPLSVIAKRRGYLLQGGVYDYERAAAALLDDFRAGKLGKITLEIPPEYNETAN